MEKKTIAVKYVGRRDSWTDRLYGTGLTFTKDQVRFVPSESARQLLKHTDLFTEDATAKPAPQKKTDDTEQAMAQAEAQKAEQNAKVNAVADLHDQVNQMTKDALEQFAKDKFNIDLDKRQKVDELKKEVHTLIDRFGSQYGVLLLANDTGNRLAGILHYWGRAFSIPHTQTYYKGVQKVTLSELVQRFRIASFDKVEPYFFSDEEVTMWLNDAEREAAIRGRLIRDHSTAGVATIPMVADASDYPLHPAFYEIEYIGYEYTPPLANQGLYDDEQEIKLISQEMMTSINPNWRNHNDVFNQYGHTLRYAVQYDTHIRLVPTPKFNGKLYVEGYRVPIKPMAGMDDVPEINAIHHEYLVQWALYRAFSVPDTETFDPNRAAIAEREFTQYFGLRPDSDLRRITREDTPHEVEPWFI